MKIDNRIANFVKVKNQSSAMEKIMEKKRDKDAVLFFRSMGFMPVVKIRRAFRPYWKLRSVFWKADAKKKVRGLSQ